MPNTHVHIPEDYAYEAPSGQQFTGRVAFVLNHLDSAEASLEDKHTAIGLWAADKSIHEALSVLLDKPEILARYL